MQSVNALLPLEATISAAEHSLDFQHGEFDSSLRQHCQYTLTREYAREDAVNDSPPTHYHGFPPPPYHNLLHKPQHPSDLKCTGSPPTAKSPPSPAPSSHPNLSTPEQAALPKASASHGSPPANAQGDTGFDKLSGNWIYPLQSQFFAAMRRKGHEAEAKDMETIIPIHNAVNEKAWAEILEWERPWSEGCGGPKLVSFAGDSKSLTPRARWKGLWGYSRPFDRHDWVVDRCGKRVEYVIDFYSGKGGRVGDEGLNFYLDVRPKLNS
ncbi:Cytochrome c1 heme lyase [Elasticomyces elasticus]|nr:Cytochrome c1 heme lyase [Elasticomyces elasticus]